MNLEDVCEAPHFNLICACSLEQYMKWSEWVEAVAHLQLEKKIPSSVNLPVFVVAFSFHLDILKVGLIDMIKDE